MGKLLELLCSRCGFGLNNHKVGNNKVIDLDNSFVEQIILTSITTNPYSPCFVPSYCTSHDLIVTRDCTKKWNKCPSCKFIICKYGSIENRPTINRGNIIFQWYLNQNESYVLRDGSDYCPNCYHPTLNIRTVGNWI